MLPRRSTEAHDRTRGRSVPVLILTLATAVLPRAGLACPARYSIAFSDSNSDEVRVAPAGDVNGDGYDDLLVGTPHWGPPYHYGAVHVHLGGPGGIDPEPAWQVFGSYTEYNWGWFIWQGGEMGQDVAAAGDLNGDGYDDVIFSEPGWRDWGAGLGTRVHIYFGSPDGLGAEPAWLTVGWADSPFGLGQTVAGVGDVNNDGYADAMYSATADVPRLLLGSASGPEAADWSPLEASAFGSFGDHDLAAAGDVNGDGYDDVFLNAGNSQDPVSTVLLYLGEPGGLSSEAAWTASSPVPDDTFGWGLGHVLAGGGDVNADGYDDVLIGAPATTLDYEIQGAAYLYLGGEGGLGASAAWTVVGVEEHALLGWEVAFAGDVNADSHDDALVGETDTHGATAQEGAASLYFGTPTGLEGTSEWREEGGLHYARFGTRLAGLGNTDGDGYEDFAIGANAHTLGGTDGAYSTVFVYQGTESWPEPPEDDTCAPDDDDSLDDDDTTDDDDSADDDDSSGDDDSAVQPDDDDSAIQPDDDDSAQPPDDGCKGCSLAAPVCPVLTLPLLALAVRRRRR